MCNDSPEKRKRIDYLDMAKGIGIILVVAGHSTLVSESALTWLASFHMPLFFIISGMLLWHNKEEEKSMRELLRRKARGIMIPYISFSVIFMCILLLFCFLHKGNITAVDIQKNLVQISSLGGVSVLWFLSTLFFGEIIFLYIRKKTNHRVTVGLVIFLVGAAVIGKTVFERRFSMDTDLFHLWLGSFVKMWFRSAVACGFLAIGYYTKMFLKERETICRGEIAAGVLCFFLNLYLSLKNGRVDLNFLEFSNPILYFFNAYLGTMAVILICKNCKTLRFLTYLGVNSLIIMATHMDWQVLAIALKITERLGQRLNGMPAFFEVVTAGLSILVMELIIIRVFNRYFYFLLGKKKPVQKN